MNMYDVLIVGGGVAGVTAAVYAKRRGKKVAIIEEMLIGGQLASIEHIENFPSYKKISGEELMLNFQAQVKSLEIEIIRDRIEEFDILNEEKVLTGKKGEYHTKSVIIATGLENIKLGIGEEELLGKGVSYCAICDANFFKSQDVAVFSKKGTGIRAAMELARQSKNVYLFDSKDISNFEKNNNTENIKVYSNCNIKNINLDETIKSIDVDINGKVKNFAVSGVFVELGKKPKTDKFSKMLKLDERGYIITDEHMETSVKGVFACGDIRSGVLKQLITACADGATAGTFA